VRRGPRPPVTYQGETYKVRSHMTAIPDLDAMNDGDARAWLARYAYDRDTSYRVGPVVSERNRTPECTPWRGPLDRFGYGRMNEGRSAHRELWIKARGPIPEGMTIDHTCRFRACVNLGHLRLLSGSENSKLQTRPAPRSHCSNGHELSAENARITQTPTRGTETACRACNREAVRRYKQRRSSGSQFRGRPSDRPAAPARQAAR
jgi:hypothetical protein